MLAGKPDAAVELLLQDDAALEQMGERYYRSTVAGLLAHALYAMNDVERALAYAGAREEAVR